LVEPRDIKEHKAPLVRKIELENKRERKRKEIEKTQIKKKELKQAIAKYQHTAKIFHDKIVEKERKIQDMGEQVAKLEWNVGRCNYLEQKVKQKQSEVEKLRELISCPICMERNKDTAFKPCNHSLCNKCVSTILGNSQAENRIGRCPICRMEVDAKYPIYL